MGGPSEGPSDAAAAADGLFGSDASSPPDASDAAPPPYRPGTLGLDCAPRESADHIHYLFCSGYLPSFDGVLIDVDVTIPLGGAARPLVVFAHGLGNDKTEWESNAITAAAPDKSHYNNVSFVARGYTVLTYSARGYHKSCGPEDLW